MYKPLEIEIKTLWTWEYTYCNDCDSEKGCYKLKYPRMKRGTIIVCFDCFNKYYRKDE